MEERKVERRPRCTQWSERYRPRHLEDILCSSETKGFLHALFLGFAQKGKAPHMILYGPPGTGKTTIVSWLARQLAPQESEDNLLRVNASLRRSRGSLSEVVRQFCEARRSAVSVVFLDECDELNEFASVDIERLMRTYVDKVVFALTCNVLTNVSIHIQNQCSLIRMNPPQFGNAVRRLRDISHREGSKNIDSRALKELVRATNGDMRSAITILQVSLECYNYLNYECMYALLGHPSRSMLDDIIRGMCSGTNIETFRKGIRAMHELVSLGYTQSIFSALFAAIQSSTSIDEGEREACMSKWTRCSALAQKCGISFCVLVTIMT